jgi:NhaP-type Na+/H+ or K+/H+ antiporter
VFLAAFAAGVALATVSEPARRDFEGVGERASEVLKFAALLMFGIVLGLRTFREADWRGWAFAAAVLLIARPAAILLSLLWSELPWRERLTAAWFGPRGFASVVFGLMILNSRAPGTGHLFGLVAITVALSIVAHSSTDVLATRLFHANDPRRAPADGDRQVGQDPYAGKGTEPAAGRLETDGRGAAEAPAPRQRPGRVAR